MSPAKTLNDVLPREEAGATIRDHAQPAVPARLPAMGFISKGFLFLRICAFASIVPYLLRLKITTVAKIIEPGEDRPAAADDRANRITKYIEIAMRHGKPAVRPGCLTRGTTRYYFLRRAGVDVTLCFGMGRRDQGFIGHCWLVKDREPYLEIEDPRLWYAEMYRISRNGGGTFAAGEAGGLMRFS
jgi:Transglutaminase-like superfamily